MKPARHALPRDKTRFLWCRSAFRFFLWLSQSTTTNPHEQSEFTVTHPFHPLKGQKFELVEYRHNWGEERVYYLNVAGELCLIPASFTDVIPPDPFVAVSHGRSRLRVVDLLELVNLCKSHAMK